MDCDRCIRVSDGTLYLCALHRSPPLIVDEPGRLTFADLPVLAGPPLVPEHRAARTALGAGLLPAQSR